jgi:hypothetical protein
VVAQNKLAARQARVVLAQRHMPSSDTAAQQQLAAAQALTPLYRGLPDLPDAVQALRERHAAHGPALTRLLSQRRQLLRLKQQALATRYRAAGEAFSGYLRHEGELATAAAAAAAGAPGGGGSGGGFGSARGASGSLGGAFGGRSTRGSAHSSDLYMCKSVLDEQRLLRVLRAEEGLKRMTAPPDQQLDPWQRRWAGFANNNGWVEDPVRELDGESV